MLRSCLQRSPRKQRPPFTGFEPHNIRPSSSVQDCQLRQNSSLPQSLWAPHPANSGQVPSMESSPTVQNCRGPQAPPRRVGQGSQLHVFFFSSESESRNVAHFWQSMQYSSGRHWTCELHPRCTGHVPSIPSLATWQNTSSSQKPPPAVGHGAQLHCPCWLLGRELKKAWHCEQLSQYWLFQQSSCSSQPCCCGHWPSMPSCLMPHHALMPQKPPVFVGQGWHSQMSRRPVSATYFWHLSQEKQYSLTGQSE
mmetsp:Transcript_10769/g.19961  ORF Transcript_10769/g.19961 Transcript_10769/m.19961 type:complete len:252 (+) Transcript_10769:3684-4439(+)